MEGLRMASIVKDDNITLGKALDRIKKMEKLAVPRAWIDVFDRLYGHTSTNSSRHAASQNSAQIQQEEAILFLVTCSAFVNYLNKIVLLQS